MIRIGENRTGMDLAGKVMAVGAGASLFLEFTAGGAFKDGETGAFCFGDRRFPGDFRRVEGFGYVPDDLPAAGGAFRKRRFA